MNQLFKPAIFFLLFSVFFSFQNSAAEKEIPLLHYDEAFSRYSTPWVDSVFASLTLDQRIAQLLMVRVRTDQKPEYYEEMVQKIHQHNIGGVAFFRGSPVKQAQFTNRLQHVAQTPLLVAMDAEWGPSMRLDSTIQFPRQMTLGAIGGESQIYQMGMEVGRQLKRLGVHINFAPVIDVNNNPKNPVINSRSFGECRYNVARKGIAYMHGLQDAGIIACAKHFPGHGDTDQDSHHTLPYLRHSFEEVDSVHLYPFKKLFENGLHSVMVAHLQIPSLEREKDLASTLSHNIVTNLLQIEMGFNGLIITDALDMRGVSDYFEPGELELRALMAGNDILLLPEDVPAAIQSIKTAIHEGILDEEFLNYKCRKVLYYKQLAGLEHQDPVQLDNLVKDLNNNRANLLNKELIQSSITLVKNEQNLVPITRPAKQKIATLAIGDTIGNSFQSMLDNYYPFDHYFIDKQHTIDESRKIIEKMMGYDLVIISVHDNSQFITRNYGLNKESINLIKDIASGSRVILSLFANPYSLSFFERDIEDVEAILVGFQDGEIYEESAAQIIFGGLSAKGRLPVSVSPYFPVYKGYGTPKGFRVQFAEPEEAGIDREALNRIDTIALKGISEEAFPGCQIAIIKDGKVIYHKAFGYHTYEKETPVKPTDIYDLASVTKIAATTAAVMRLSDELRINPDHHLGFYLPWLEGSDKENIELRQLLAHQARLRPWIPFFLETLNEGKPDENIFRNKKMDDFTVKVAREMFMNKNYLDTIKERILSSPLLNQSQYRYSDLGFIMLSDIIEKQSGKSLDYFTEEMFYKPMGLATLGFRPLERFDTGRIVPSENDTLFRRQIIQGHVNDPAAAMLGGVGGHAGLFGNALDLAVFMQMFLQEGEYAGIRYINASTLEEFTRVQFAGNQNRRGLGFDKPSIILGEDGPACKSASPLSFGHSGFTGTYAWVDPLENLVYVFLSNRTFPDQTNRKIVEMNIRTKIHQVVYDAIYQSRLLETMKIP